MAVAVCARGALALQLSDSAHYGDSGEVSLCCLLLLCCCRSQNGIFFGVNPHSVITMCVIERVKINWIRFIAYLCCSVIIQAAL